MPLKCFNRFNKKWFGHEMEKLAILGGTPVVDIPHPHFVWPEVSETEIRAVFIFFIKF